MKQYNELTGIGNSYDFGARMYDSRIGRWASVDFLFSKYADLSPYSISNNNPIYNREVDGNYWVDYKICGLLSKHSKQHGGIYYMLYEAKYYYTNIRGLQALNYAANVPFSPEVSWTATASKAIIAMMDNSVSFGATDWAGIMLNVLGASISKSADNLGKIVIDLNRSATGITFEALQEFKGTDYYKLYLDERAFEILNARGILQGDKFDQRRLDEWHEEGIKLIKSKDEKIMKKYRVGQLFGTQAEAVPSKYVEDKMTEEIESARTQAAKELESKIKK